MTQHTRGIVLKYFPYSESSIIVKIFTEIFGLQSYIVKGLRSGKSRTSLALFQPLTIIEFVAYHKENKSIHHLREPKVEYHYQSIPNDVNKRSILFFLAELLYKTIREEVPDKSLFEWLHNALTWFDLSEKSIMSYHLVFMLQFSRYLGFYPKLEGYGEVSYFDMQEGIFCTNRPQHPQYISSPIAEQLKGLYQCTFEDSDALLLHTADRRKLLNALIVYFQLHIPGFGDMKSVEVLKTII